MAEQPRICTEPRAPFFPRTVAAVLALFVFQAGGCSCFEIGEFSCGLGGPEPCSEYEKGDRRCNDNRYGDNFIEECKLDDDGTLAWLRVVYCYERLCVFSDGEPVCADCYEDDQCSPAGGTRCRWDVLQECREGVEYDDFTCTYWYDLQDCADDGMICSESDGTPMCVPGCENACSSSGATRCDGSVVQACSPGEGECLSWTPGVDCSTYGLTCAELAGNGRCMCPDPCPEGPVLKTVWEQFGPWSAEDYTRDAVDASGHSIIFTRSTDAIQGYSWDVFSDIDGFPIEPGTGAAGGELVGSDDMVAYELSAMGNLSFFGQEYTDILIDPHGAVLFGVGEVSETGCLQDFFSFPRIASFLTDSLSLVEGGSIVVDEFFDRLCVTFEDVPISETDIRCSFQISIDAEGTIGLHYVTVDAPAGEPAVIGISNGGGLGAYPVETNFIPCSDRPWCDPPLGDWEMFTGAVRSDYTDISGHALVFTPDPESPSLYSWSASPSGGDYPVEPGTGDASLVVFPGAESAVEYPFTLLEGFSFFERPYKGIFVNPNGSITFDEGDSGTPHSIEDLFYVPRIGGFIAQLGYDEESRVTVDEFIDRVAVTYDHVFTADGSSTCGFQVILDASGAVGLHYLKAPVVPWAVVGLFNGGILGDAPAETDFIACSGRPWCQSLFAAWESFGHDICDTVDVSGHSITFTPLPGYSGIYTWEESGGLTEFPFMPGDGAVSQQLEVPEDGYAEVLLMVAGDVEFFGISYPAIYVNASGSVTFDGGGLGGIGGEGFFSMPLVGGFVTDLDPTAGGRIVVDEYPGLVVVTYDGVPLADGSAASSFQITMDASGAMGLHYVDVSLGSSESAIIGISNAGRPATLDEKKETDFISTTCSMPETLMGYWENFSREDPPDISGHSITFVPMAEDPQGYTWTALGGLTGFPTQPGTGLRSTLLPFHAGGTEMVHDYTFGEMDGFPLFDEEFSGFVVGTHGTILFEGAERNPVINVFRAPFSMSETSFVMVDEFSSKTVVTFYGMLLDEPACRPMSFQVALQDNGRIGLHYLMIDRMAEGEIGLLSDEGSGARPAETNFCD